MAVDRSLFTVTAKDPEHSPAEAFMAWVLDRQVWSHGMAHLWDNVALWVALTWYDTACEEEGGTIRSLLSPP